MIADCSIDLEADPCPVPLDLLHWAEADTLSRLIADMPERGSLPLRPQTYA